MKGKPASRNDRASRLINAPPRAIYGAFVNPAALAPWLPPKGMTAEIFAFEPRAGGAFRMALTHDAAGRRGKTEGNKDVLQGRFVELVEDERIVWAVTFRSDDPSFASEMTMTWRIPAPVAGRRGSGGAEAKLHTRRSPALS
jgi:uncharacterized protein YndB with AHSA1/START domain